MQTSRWERVRGALTPAEWRRAGMLALVIVGLHVIGFGLLLGFVVPEHLTLGDGAGFTVGLGITAYTLGLGTPSTPTTSARSTTRRAS